MSIPRHKLFSSVLLGGLLAQYAVVGLFGGSGEPWPVLVLPAFQQTWAADSEAAFDRLRLAAEMETGDRRAVPLEDLLAALPATHHPAVARAHFGCSGASPALAGWTRRRLEALFPDARPARLHIVWERVSVPLATGIDGARTSQRAACVRPLPPPPGRHR